MLRTAARAFAAATLAVGLLVPAVPAAAAAPVEGRGWVVALLDAVVGWLTPFGRSSISSDEALPKVDTDGFTTSKQKSTGESGETYPNLDPDGLTFGPAGPQGHTGGGQEDTLPNIDPNG